MPVTTIAYGRALYYPHINFQNQAWAKSAALYYKGLNRIVPESYGPTQDVEIIQRLNDEEEFTREIHPGYAADYIARDFIRFAEKNLVNEQYREELLAKLGRAADKEPFSIHAMKMGSTLKRKLPRLGLAQPERTFSIHAKKISYMAQRWLPATGLVKRPEGPGSEDWYEFEPATGAMYMTFLANFIAEQDHLPLVTDNPIFQPLITSSQLEQIPTRGDIGQTLASMVIKAAVPVDVANIPAKRIIAFRKKFDDQRHLFYNEINKLVKDLQGIENADALKDSLEHKQKDIALAVKDLQRAYRSMKISTVVALLGVSVPSFLSGLGAGIATGGLITVGTARAIEQGDKYYKSKANSPYGYVLSLRKNLKAETFAQQLLRGKLVL
jgi:hypothetical protein